MLWAKFTFPHNYCLNLILFFILLNSSVCREAYSYSHVSEQFRLRDKAILAVLYSCGLRRNEAVGLNISDVDFENKRIYVRRGSRNKKREKPYLGINDFNLNILKNYLNKSRPRFDIYHKTDALFVNKNGTRMLGKTFSDRLKAIIKATENEEIQEKKITPHSLRHSVETHLLQNGLSIEKVSKFLGHSNLESTQIYTHLAEFDDDE
ncbi:tyrosine-type recombinase/integrase [Tenacibaculum maritimum]|uniref:tyrosine-type recombinase/integrase n=1 Tax=Tenacibaculum maritimum TaxID=107401 RepID=UPI0038773AAE